MSAPSTCSVGVAKVRKVALSCFQACILNLYNVRTKACARNTLSKSDREPPLYTMVDADVMTRCLEQRLSQIFVEGETAENTLSKSDREPPLYTMVDADVMTRCLEQRLSQIFVEGETAEETLRSLGRSLLTETSVGNVMTKLSSLYSLCRDLVSLWVDLRVGDKVFDGVLPTSSGESGDSALTTEVDTMSNRLYLHWPREQLGHDFLPAARRMLRNVREAGRQPTEAEYFFTHLSYLDISNGCWTAKSDDVRPLGTSGFRPHTQTYMSLMDAGDGHVLGTTRFCDWLQGVIVHVEDLGRPRQLSHEKVESNCIPSIVDFARVRLHVSDAAPTTYFIGRAVRDSGNFDEDFLKVVHLTAAAASAAFFLGAAECKIAMETLSTSQALRYMRALKAQVQRSKNQFLSAAWNLNQVFTDDFDCEEAIELKERKDIAMRAIEITALGGFDKVTWDIHQSTGCIINELGREEALTIVHEAHQRGLVTYFSSGFKIRAIEDAVFTGVDGIGIEGNAEVLHYVENLSRMHGPYREENIPHILTSRDEAAESTRGRGVRLLARLDTMYFEGSLSREEDALRQQLFAALLAIDEIEIETLIQDRLARISALPEEGTLPHLHRAKRLMDAEEPMLKEFCSKEEWAGFVRVLRALIMARDEASIMEAYDSDPWLSLKEKYRASQHPANARVCYVRQASFMLHVKAGSLNALPVKSVTRSQ